MERESRTRSLALGALVGVVSLSLPLASFANELGASAHPTSFVIHDANETLRDYCAWDGGRLYLSLPGGSRWELITSTADPAIANPGDGSFHPFDTSEVQSALEGVRFPLAHVSAEVFVLPYPRRLGLESCAGPGLILLAPGVRAVSREQQHAEFTHELGHVVQYALLPDTNGTRWTQYRDMRGIADGAEFAASAIHCDRPHEIFAEDFRALFGDGLANYSGTIENSDLAYPTRVQGLTTFLSDLSDGAAAANGSTRLSVESAAGAALTFGRAGGGVAPLDLFDLAGRHVATVLPTVAGSGARWQWDGRDVAGRTIRGAVVFARARDGVGGALRIARLF